MWVTGDFFDTDESDRMIEHWDVIAAYVPQTPSGHTSVDGATEVVDFDKTDENKALVRRMIQDLFMRGGDPSKARSYISENYIQHNGEVPDGLTPIEALLMEPDRPLWYQEIVLLVGQGNFVATLCRATWEDQEYAQVDIFRIEDGLVAEHWDVVEPVPPREEWVNSGKF